MPNDLMRSERGAGGPALVMSQLLGLWRQQGRGRQLAALAALLVVAAGVAWVSLAERAPRWVTVVSAHRDEETRACVATLQRGGVAVRARGRDVEVAPEMVERARAVLAAAGLPDAGKGLEPFAAGSIWATSFTEQVSYRRAQQEELARSIKALAPVDEARVHLAMGKPSIFKKRELPPAASVSLQLRAGAAISAAQVQGIRQLVVGAVEGMKAEDVAVIDQAGNLLGGLDGPGGAIGGQVELERGVEAKVRGLLERLVGMGNVEVVAAAELDLRRVEETAEVYERERSALTAETRTRPIAAGGAVSAGAGGGGAAELLQESATYAPSHVVTETRFPGARLRRLQLSVLIDTRRGAAQAASPAELELWSALARSAAGLDEGRGDRLELRAAEFAPPAPVVAQIGRAHV
jgi:flagellar M-ring protein FliF